MARCKPNDARVAVKLTELEKYQGNTELVSPHLDMQFFGDCSRVSMYTAVSAEDAGWVQEQLIQEAHIMKGFRHPNLLPLYCSFIHESDLWLVMPFIAGGSLGNILTTR